MSSLRYTRTTLEFDSPRFRWPELSAHIGAWAAAASFALTGLVVACMALLGGHLDRDAYLMQPMVFRVAFGAALVLVLAQVPVGLALTAISRRRSPALATAGGVFVMLSVPINAVVFFLGAAVLPALYRMPQGHPESEALLAALQIGDPMAPVGMLPVLGFAMLGLGWVLLARGVTGLDLRWTGAATFMVFTGVAALVGLVGAALGVPGLLDGTLVGGALGLLTFGMLAFLFWNDADPEADIEG